MIHDQCSAAQKRREAHQLEIQRQVEVDKTSAILRRKLHIDTKMVSRMSREIDARMAQVILSEKSARSRVGRAEADEHLSIVETQFRKLLFLRIGRTVMRVRVLKEVHTSRMISPTIRCDVEQVVETYKCRPRSSETPRRCSEWVLD